MSVELFRQSFFVDNNIKKIESDIELKKTAIKTNEQELVSIDVTQRPLIEKDIQDSIRRGGHVANLGESLKDLKKPVNDKISILRDELKDLEANLELLQEEKKALEFAELKKNEKMRKCQQN